MKKFPYLSDSTLRIFTLVIIVIFPLLPLFIALPYRVNIFVTWEGAYRMLQGHMPYRDFGMPVGYGFWLIPYAFFLVFGPFMASLVKAQVFINIVSLLLFRGIFKLFNFKEATIFFAVLIMFLSFVMINFWPWYNHTVFFYELIVLYFVIRYLILRKAIFTVAIGGFFTIIAILTKQDGGGLTLMLTAALLIIDTFYSKNWKPLALYALSLLISAGILILPFLQYDFSYWFNYGQSPHYSRVSGYHLLHDIFGGSLWIKGYILIILLIIFSSFKRIPDFIKNRHYVLLCCLILGILVQAAIIQVTSFSPPTVNLYFHSFALAFILFSFQHKINYNYSVTLIFLSFIIIFWRSENYWKYSQPIFTRFAPTLFSPPPANVVAKGNWAPADTVKKEPVQWKLTEFKSLKRIKLPTSTGEGIRRIKDLSIIQNNKELKVLNMTNLTPLAYELNYKAEKGPQFPLWYHQGVSLFDREIEMFCEKINNKEFDLILFESMPDVDNFFPYEIRNCALDEYRLIDKFLSPTGYRTDSIEVYIRKVDGL